MIYANDSDLQSVSAFSGDGGKIIASGECDNECSSTHTECEDHRRISYVLVT